MNRPTAAVLSFTAGFVDTATFVAVAGLFSAHVTGNFVLFAADAATGLKAADALKLLTFPTFLFAASFTTLLHSRLPAASAARWLIGFKAALLVLAAIASYVFLPDRASSREVTLVETLVAMIVVFAMGAQNASHHLIPGYTPLTTVMTGNMGQLMVKATRYAQLRHGLSMSEKREHRDGITKLINVAVAFAVGCLASAFLTTHFGLIALLLPAAILAALLLAPGRGV